MKLTILKAFALPVLLILLAQPALSQRSKVKVYSSDAESGNCWSNVSAYRTFYNLKLYHDAHPTWLKVFNACPDSSERIYVDGATMYRSFIDSTANGPIREGLIDTLMLIYDRRMEYFGGEGNVLGRKGKDLLNYRGSDINQVKQANEMLRTSIEIQGEKSQEAVLFLCVSSGVVLHKKGLLDEDQLIADYVLVAGNLVKLEKKSSRWKRTRSRIDELLLKEDILSCKALDNFFAPFIERHRDVISFQETAISCYKPVGCERSPVYTVALENLYRIAPGPESAHNLALQFIAINDLEKADFYLKEALKGENIKEETRALWYYELAVLSNAREDYCQAIGYAREATRLNSNYGKAYILLGDAIISSRRSLGDDFQRRTAYWAAADMYEKASMLDPSLSEEAQKKLSRCTSQYPDREDIFFSDIREGQAYVVEGCINDTTTVRARE
jgi:tetratricopeptide (TPR) repeat protein